MRRFFTVAFIILALAVSAAGVAPAAHAENAQEGEACEIGIGGCAVGLVCDAKGICQKDSGVIFGPAEPTQAEKDAAAKIAAEQGRAESARWGLNYVMQMIAGLFAWLVGVAALTLNFSMYYTVVNMGGYVTNLPAIRTVWEILRDIGNILLIFGFLAIGISIIIDSDWYGGGQKLLPKLLIVAVFANFSLFAAEAMIDVGNLFATQIYRQINGGEIVAPMGATDAFWAVINKKGVAGVLMNRLGLASIYGQVLGKDKDGNNIVTGTGPWYMGFMSSIVFIVVAFVMFTLAFILISRFIVLILLIMVSPVGVAGLAVPGLQSWAKKWWDTLFHQTITAPILLLMLYIALSVIVDKNFLGFGTTTPAWGGTETGYIMEFAGTLLSYLIAMGLLLAVVYFAKTLSAVGAGWATKTAGKLSFGATAFVGRRTIGRASNYTARKIRSSSLGRSETGRLLAGLADRGAKASYDVRGTSALKNIPGGGIDAGAAQKGGYRGTEDSAIKAREDYAKSLKEREQTDTEKRKIKDKVENRKQSERDHEEAAEEHKRAKEEQTKQQKEVARLETEQKNNMAFAAEGGQAKLDAARKSLATSESNLTAAATKLNEAAKTLKEDKEAEQKITEDIKYQTSAKGAQQAYGKALQEKTFLGVPRLPYDWTTVAGSSRREAAKKILYEKPTKDKLADILKQMNKEDEEAAGKEGKDKEEKESKPEAPKP